MRFSVLGFRSDIRIELQAPVVLDLKIVHKDSTSAVSALVQMFPGRRSVLLS